MIHRLTPPLIIPLLWISAAAPAAPAPSIGYATIDQLGERTLALAARSPRCEVHRFGTSRQQRELYVLTLSADPVTAHERPALLITAGLDGRHRAGSEVALRVAEHLIEHDDPALLEQVTVYVIPLVNPDGARYAAAPLRRDHGANVRPLDEDRDGLVDEDPPSDVNGDGFITMMRRLDPPLDDPPTHAADPVEPRLLVKADPLRGDRAIYSVYIEGFDSDGDGRIGEDGPGGIVLDRNFLHEWPEHDPAAGPYQLSEPESHALARFVLERPNIVAAITYGLHDNLVNVPDGKAKDVSGRGPKVLDADDVPLYHEIAKIFTETTSVKRSSDVSTDGSFHAWLYAQRGIPSFATIVWGRPEEAGAGTGSAGVPPAGSTEPAPDTDPDAAPAPDDHPPQNDKHHSRAAAESPRDKEAAAWLALSDARNGAGFVPWSPFDHPTLGAVEIGGFIPGFMINPPPDELDALAGEQAAFAQALLERLPRLALDGPAVRRLGAGLYEVRLALVNEGYLPTATAMARKARSFMPTVVRLEIDLEQILAGDRVSRHWGIDGSGGRAVNHWIIRVPDDSPVTVHVANAQLGERTITFDAVDDGAAPAAGQEDIP